MRKWTDIASWSDPTHKVMAAQALNIARIAAGVQVRHDFRGNDVVLVGPAPDIIRLYDTPQRLMRKARWERAERVVTIGPFVDKSDAMRNSNKDARAIEYGVACGIKLTEAEQSRDIQEEGEDSPLARKAADWVHDFRGVFLDNLHLINDECPTGLVDDASYDIVWDPDIQYPETLVIIHVRASLYV